MGKAGEGCQKKRGSRTSIIQLKVEGRALGLLAGPTGMEKFRNNKRFWESLEMLEIFCSRMLMEAMLVALSTTTRIA